MGFLCHLRVDLTQDQRTKYIQPICVFPHFLSINFHVVERSSKYSGVRAEVGEAYDWNKVPLKMTLKY